jgi:hypothetical protein
MANEHLRVGGMSIDCYSLERLWLVPGLILMTRIYYPQGWDDVVVFGMSSAQRTTSLSCVAMPSCAASGLVMTLSMEYIR